MKPDIEKYRVFMGCFDIPESRKIELIHTVWRIMEGFASGRFESQGEVQAFLQSHTAFPKDRHGEVHIQRIKELLSCTLYTGYMDVPKWGLSLYLGKHEPLITFETWQRIQDCLNGIMKAPARKDLHQDFRYAASSPADTVVPR